MILAEAIEALTKLDEPVLNTIYDEARLAYRVQEAVKTANEGVKAGESESKKAA